jgi:protein ImuB
MPARRILSLWFPRLGAERLLRQADALRDTPFAVLRDTGQMQVLVSLSEAASGVGLHHGQPLRDALAMCPELVTRLQNPQAEAAFLNVLQRWAGKFSPWVAALAPDGLVLDVTGCTHLFGGEETLLAQIEGEVIGLGLSCRMGLADTQGAAWALARFAGVQAGSHRSGDAIEQEARATRSRAAKRRHWERGGARPALAQMPTGQARIAEPGSAHSMLAPLPVAALRLESEVVQQLSRLGLRRIGDLIGQPRAALARRFGKGLVLRLDQALGAVPEPVSPAKPPPRYAVRMTLPDPIGLEDDILAALDKLLPALGDRLQRDAKGARLVRLQAFRTDQTMGWIEAGLARPTHDPERIRPLLRMKLDDLDAGYGIDLLRLEAVQVEPVSDRRPAGHLDAALAARDRISGARQLEDLISRIGARVGLEAITRRHPGNSHIPEKAAQTLAAAWSEPAQDWPAPPTPRPVLLWQPEPVIAPDSPQPPATFRWRRQELALKIATGPERIAPEWWLDDPNWRSGVRDYWQVTTDRGERLWLFYAHGAAMSSGWFCQGQFA